MATSKLPRRIAAVMMGTVVILVLTVALSVVWMTRAMDEQSRRHSAERVRTALIDALDQIRSTTLDYAKREETARRVAARDLRWLRHNVGTSAVFGDLVQLAVIWGGPLTQNVGWTDSGGSAPRSGVLDPAVLGLAEAGLAGLPLDSYQGVTFFTWRNGEVVALAAARIEPMIGSEGDPALDGEPGRLALGRRLDPGTVRRLADSVLLDGLEIVRAKPEDRPSLPLMGGDARPVAHLAWTPELAGSALVRRMLPVLTALVGLSAGGVMLAMVLARRGAERLVRAEQASAASARTDGLTGLPNRLAFTEALEAPARAGGRAILFLDLNGFKRINDSMGHAAGDLVIARMAERLGTLVEPDCRLARIGGDEFVFMVMGLCAERRAERLTAAVEALMAKPFEVHGHEMRLRAAMGYAVQADDATSGADLVRQADLAMYEAKRLKAGPVAFGEVIGKADRDARAIEGALREALARGDELRVAYQPIVDVATGRMVRAEALARWTSPTLGVVPPDRFVAVAEQAGLMVELGWRILALVCDDLEAHPALAASVNVSPLQLLAPTFVPGLTAELARRGLSPSRLEVELTERMIVDDSALAAKRLGELASAGFSTALDDFGTGYSSIGYLRQMPFDTLKADRSLVTGLGSDAGRLALCNTVVVLAQGLGLALVCEGVETAEDLDVVGSLGCRLAQGYHLDRPLPIGALAERWLLPARAAVA